MYEYMVCGRAVIASNISGYGHLITEQEAGISVDSGNAENIANAIIRLFHNPVIRKKMGENGRKAVEREFNWDIVSIKAENFIKKVLSS